MTDIKGNWYRSAWWTQTVYPGVLDRLMDRYFDRFPRNRRRVMEEDWDTLLLLDACRYDIFEERNGLPGTLESRLSSGSNTGEFFDENFADEQYYDTVYVTANPVPRVDEWCRVDVDSVFHDVVDVWERHWDDGVNTVRPEPVADAIRSVHAEYPDKRIIGHFIQPHQPFIGETGQQIDERGMEAFDKLSGGDGDARKQVWEQLEDGDISADRAWQAYAENLDLVLPHVRALCRELTGKAVVSSDHGNLFGERAWPFPVRRYGHPRGVHTRKLVKVPWLETEFETRRNVTAEPPRQSAANADDDERLERLEHLGYR